MAFFLEKSYNHALLLPEGANFVREDEHEYPENGCHNGNLDGGLLLGLFFFVAQA
jgi:hypothetical protein